MANGVVTIASFTPKVETPKAKVYDSKRDAKKIDNLLHMERHFEALNMEDEKLKVRMATRFSTVLDAV